MALALLNVFECTVDVRPGAVVIDPSSVVESAELHLAALVGPRGRRAELVLAARLLMTQDLTNSDAIVIVVGECAVLPRLIQLLNQLEKVLLRDVVLNCGQVCSYIRG